MGRRGEDAWQEEGRGDALFGVWTLVHLLGPRRKYKLLKVGHENDYG